MEELVKQLKRHEGLRLKPYKCTANKTSIGVGRNLDDIGISEKEAEMLLLNDIEEAKRQLAAHFPWTADLDEVRLAALINFTFNVGIGTVAKFVNAMALLKDGKYDMAAEEFLQSRWANQVGQRAIDVTEQIRTGEWQ
jgi:lysozyme